ncbi:MAG: S8 family serine peptidase [Phycisphaerae bacterium]|nr:S8 family serine peptidase [Phycisphaerae bacterium]
MTMRSQNEPSCSSICRAGMWTWSGLFVLGMALVLLGFTRTAQAQHDSPWDVLHNREMHEDSPWDAVAGPHAAGRVLVKIQCAHSTLAADSSMGLPGVERLVSLSPVGSEMKAHALGTRPRWFIAELTEGFSVEQALTELSYEQDVLLVEPDYLAPPPPPVSSARLYTNGSSDPGSDQQYALERIRAYEAWDLHRGDPSLVVAVIDSGVQLDHPDLAEQMWRNPNEEFNGVDDDGNGFVDDVYGWNFTAENNNPGPTHWHGTHVAGIIAAVADNNLGVAGTADVRIMPLQVLGADGISNSDTMRAIDYAVQNGAKVINMSLGGAPYSQAYADTCANALANDVVLVAAAGNDGRGQVNYPAAYDAVISVGATDAYDQLAEFSNWGDALEVVAPGVQILSTVTESGYDFSDGTSMASPYAAGVVALIRSANPGMDAQTARGRLAATTDDLGQQGWDAQTGYGRINAYLALSTNPTPAPSPTPPGGDDQYEENDSGQQAARIQPGTYQLEGLDADIFLLNVTASTTLTVQTQGNAGNLDLGVFTTDAEPQALGTSEGPDSNETVASPVQPGDYFVVVVPINGQTASYTMNVSLAGNPTPSPSPTPPGGDDQYEENDSGQQAARIQPGTYQLEGLDADIFLLNVTASTTLTVQTQGNAGNLDLGVFTTDAEPQALGLSEGPDSNETVTAAVQPGDYFILVVPINGQTCSYTMNVSLAGNPTPTPTPTPSPTPTPTPTPTPSPTPPGGDDQYEENDTAQQAAFVQPGSHQLQGMDQDWFRIRVSEPSILTITVDGPDGDLDLGLADSNQNALAISENFDSHERIEILVEPDDLYLLVMPYEEGKTSSYGLNVSVEPYQCPPCGPCAPLPMVGVVAGVVGFRTIGRRRTR